MMTCLVVITPCRPQEADTLLGGGRGGETIMEGQSPACYVPLHTKQGLIYGPILRKHTSDGGKAEPKDSTDNEMVAQEQALKTRLIKPYLIELKVYRLCKNTHGTVQNTWCTITRWLP